MLVRRSGLQLLLLCCLLKNSISAAVSYGQVGKENLKSFSHVQERFGVSGYKRYYQLLDDALAHQLRPTVKRQRSILFPLLGFDKQQETSDVIDFISIQNLELVCGPLSNLQAYIAEKIDDCSTQAGSIALLWCLTNPTDNIDELVRRQAIIRYLFDNRELF